MTKSVHPERRIANSAAEQEPGESAVLKITLEPLGIEVGCTIPERHSAKMVQISGIVMTTLGSVLMLWVAAKTNCPSWLIITLVLAVLSAGTTMGRKR
jgi:hypothetical protein